MIANVFRAVATSSLLACVVLSACVPSDIVATKPSGPGLIGGPDAEGREEWMLRSTQAGFSMRTYVYRPAGPGPFPLAVISHGSDQDPVRRRQASPPSFPALTEWFRDRGYIVVLPVRPGHAAGGSYLENQGECRAPDFIKAGNGAADSIEAAVDYMKLQPFVRTDGVVVAGNSAGGWAALAYAARNPPGVRAVVNFSGGRGGHHLNKPLNNCAPELLVAAAGTYGRQTRIPTLWLYAENDTYFPPALSRAMVQAFTNAGGSADYHLLPPMPGNGHLLIQSTEWKGALGQFLGSPH